MEVRRSTAITSRPIETVNGQPAELHNPPVPHRHHDSDGLKASDGSRGAALRIPEHCVGGTGKHRVQQRFRLQVRCEDA
jgi:hypothetical protein